MLQGDLAVDPYPLGIEAFFHDERAYLYQGPVPALVRLPFVALAGDRLDGRLTALSMLAALVTAIVMASSVHWRVRRLLRGDAAMMPLERVVLAVWSFAIGGSMLLFHASRVWVYHEAILWGVAFTIAAVDQLVAHHVTRSPRSLAMASACTALALLSRASVGIGPLFGLAVVAAAAAYRWVRARGVSIRGVAATGIAAVAPLGLYAAVNFAKFGTLFSVPFRDQRYSQVDALRQEFLDANAGTMFGLQFVPTTVLRYLTPTGMRLMRQFPFVDLADPPRDRRSLGALFDVIDRAAGVPVAQPLLLVAAVAGVIAIARRRELAALRLPAIAAAASAATIFPFGYIAYRYLADAAPFLLLCSSVGTQWMLTIRRDGRARWLTIAGVTIAGVVLSAWVNLAVGLQYQRVWSAEDHPEIVAGYLDFRLAVNDALGIARPRVEHTDDDLPNGIGRPGALVVLGDCDGLYVSDGEVVNSVDRSPWNPVERSRNNGHIRLALMMPKGDPGTRLPLLSANDDFFFVSYLGGGRVSFDHESNDVDREGLPLRARPGDRLLVDVQADWRVHHVTITVDDVVALDNYYFERTPLEVTWRHAADELPVTTPLCRELVDST